MEESLELGLCLHRAVSAASFLMALPGHPPTLAEDGALAECGEARFSQLANCLQRAGHPLLLPGENSFARYHAEMNDSWLFNMIRARSRADGAAINCLVASFSMPEEVMLVNTEITHEISCVAAALMPTRRSRLAGKKKKSKHAVDVAGEESKATDENDTARSRILYVAKRMRQKAATAKCIVGPVYDTKRNHWGLFELNRTSKTCAWGDSLGFGPPSFNFLAVVVNLASELWNDHPDSQFQIDGDQNILLDRYHMKKQREDWECGYYVCGAIANMADAGCSYAAACRGKFRRSSRIETNSETVRKGMIRATFAVASELKPKTTAKHIFVTDFDVGERVRFRLALEDFVETGKKGTPELEVSHDYQPNKKASWKSGLEQSNSDGEK